MFRSARPVLVAAVLVLYPTFSFAQSDWAAVQTLPLGTRLRVEIPSEVIEGRFRGADDTRVTMNGRSVRREDIVLVQRLQSRKAEGAIWGALIGFSTGMLQSYLTAEDNKFVFGLYLGAGQGVIGALIGMGVRSPRIETIYQR